MVKKRIVAVIGIAAIAAATVSLVSAGAAPRTPTTSTYEPVLDPANFVSVIDNPYFPLPVGRVLVYKETSPTHFSTVTVTNQTKVIEGITATVVTDNATTPQGKALETTIDWFAQDKQGNVWYLGEDTKAFLPNGQVDTSGSWTAGVNDAEPGIIMEAAPQIPDSYRQEYLKGQAEDSAWIVGSGGSLKIPYGTVHNTLTTLEHSALETKVVEEKIYAPGLGVVWAKDIAGGNGSGQLVSVTG